VATYRSELEAALARVDALSGDAPPCSTCLACAERRRVARSITMLVLVAAASIAGVVAASLFLVGFAMAATGSFSVSCFGYAGLAAFFATSLYAVFARRLAV
jgi:hypothetical protein